jgi:hypothetical protein
MDREEMSILYRGPPIDDTYQISVHLAKQFQRKRFFRNQPIRNKNCLWRPCLLTDQDEMSNIYRGPSKDASYQVSVHLAKRFHRRRILKNSNKPKVRKPSCEHVDGQCDLFKNRPIKKKNCLWQPCLLMDRDEMSKLYRGPSIDASYQVSIHLAKEFRRRLKCEKLTDDRRKTTGRQMMAKAHIAFVKVS